MNLVLMMLCGFHGERTPIRVMYDIIIMLLRVQWFSDRFKVMASKGRF
jgi:hypothetical protein